MNINLTIKKSFSRAAMMLLATILFSLTAQPAWAETVNGVKYIDANGVEQTRDGVIVLTGSETTLGETGGTESSPTETWYICKENLSYSSKLESYDYCNVNIILADGVVMSVEPSSSSAIYILGSLGIYGQSTGTNRGALTATSQGALSGIYANNDVTICSAEVTATGGDAIYTCNGGVSITGGKVTANGKYYGIHADASGKDITVKDAEVTATANGSSGYAIFSYNGGVSITGGKVTANGKYYAIGSNGSDKDITIIGSEVTATSDGHAICSDRGGVTIKDAEVTATVTGSYGYAICSYNGGVSITGGKVTANGTEFGIEAGGSDKDITIKDAEVTATADGSSGYAIYSYNGGVSITGGKVTANGKYYGIGAYGSDKDITIIGSEVTATSDGTSGHAICSDRGDVTIKDAEVTATATNTSGTSGRAIYACGVSITGGKVTATGTGYGIGACGLGKDVTISGAEVTAEGNNAIYSSNGGVSITGGKITAKGTFYGIAASGSDKDVTIKEAEVTATATGTSETSGNAIFSYGSVSITGGEVTANGNYCGIGAYNNGDVTIIGSEITANGTTYGVDGAITINDGTVSITGATAISNINSYVANGGKVTLNSTSGDVYKVTFDDEWSDIPEVSLYSGSTVAEPTAPVRKGYIFAGWKNGSTLYDFNMPVTGNLTLVSVWEMKTLTHTDITIADIADQICTGSEIKPAVSIKDGETDLTEGVDYDLAYSNNINVGTATVTITGKDGYAGTGTKEFVILRQMKDLFAGGNQWTGYVAEEDLDLPAGLTAYTVTALGDKTATATAIGYLPKDEPVLLRREDKAVNNYAALAYEGTEAAPTGNLLKVASASSQPTAYRDYLLYQDGFVLVSGGTLATGQVYLSVPQASQSRTATRSIIIDGDGTTAISTTDRTALTDEGSGAWFDMLGRRYDSKPTRKGLYVRNGKKVVIK